MAKRRTKKQKVNAHHSTLVNWKDLGLDETSKPKLTEASVNRQKRSVNKAVMISKPSKKNPDYMVKDENLVSIRIDLIKSILISISIIGIEVVLYLFWV